MTDGPHSHPSHAERARAAEPALTRSHPRAAAAHPGRRAARARRRRGTPSTSPARGTATASTARSRRSSAGSPTCSARRPPRCSPAGSWPSSRCCGSGATRAGSRARRDPGAVATCCSTRTTARGCCTASSSRCSPTARPCRRSSTWRRSAAALGAVLLELPLRDAGYLLPSWDELVAFSQACRERGVPLHLDGARIWESAPHLGHSPAEIAALADSVYVSLYKGLGGLAGAAVAGPEDEVAQARVWRNRMGGTLFSLMPYRRRRPARPRPRAAADGRVPRARGAAGAAVGGSAASG